MNDLSDLHSEMAGASMAGKKSNDVHDLQKYVTGDRCKNHLGAINKSIKGSFYFGEDPTYVDFAVLSYLDMIEGKFLGPLETFTGDTIAEHAPKLRTIVTAIREFPSARKFENTTFVPSSLVLTNERTSTWFN